MFKILSLWGIGALLLLQAIRIDIPAIPTAINPKHEIEAPKEIMDMMKTSCYDCHSYQTKMPWYGNIAPISWEVRSHIKEGREWLNFQEWNTYSEEKKQKIYKQIVKTINLRMPMPMYLIIHKDAKLTHAQRNSFKKWAQNLIVEEN